MQEEIRIANTELATSQGYALHQRLQGFLEEARFDGFVDGLCRKFCATTMGKLLGRSSQAAGLFHVPPKPTREALPA